MKRLFLHAGRHKCGTSAIQHFLFTNREWLKSRGYIYPTTGMKASGHHNLAALLNDRKRDDDELREVKSRFRMEVRDYENVIVSSEAFQNVRDPAIVRRFFNGFEIVAVCYFREILDYMQSAYAQRIQNSADVISFDLFSRLFGPNYSETVRRFERSSSRLVLRLFDRDRLVGGDVVRDFLEVVELDDAPETSGVRNPSVGGNLLYFKLFVNLMGFHDRRQYRVLEEMCKADPRYSSGFRVDPALAARIRTRLRHENECLIEQFGKIPRRDFSGRPAFPETDRLADDFAGFIARPEFAGLETFVSAWLRNGGSGPAGTNGFRAPAVVGSGQAGLSAIVS